MNRHRENDRRRRRVALVLVLCAGPSLVSHAALAREEHDVKLSDQAWACSTLYSRYPIKVVNGADRDKALCLGEGKSGRKPMSRSEAWELCRDQFDATSLLIDWTSKGWRCRYYGR